MRKIKVLIVDDSAVVRRLLTDALAADPAIEVVATAANGRLGLAKIPIVKPDLVTLDVEMPELDGLATLVELRQSYPRLPVIMCSVHTQRGAAATLNALSRGASDYIAKPTQSGGPTAALKQVGAELIPKIKALCARTLEREAGTLNAATPAAGTPRIPGPIQIVTIAVSTGGPVALTEIFRELPSNFLVPIVVVQHMPPLFTRYLAERLDAVSCLEIHEAVNGEPLRPGGAWLAPGNFHMALARSREGNVIQLNQDPPENSCRPAADVLFRSVAQLFGPSALAVVLTGMGQDGLRGCRAIREAGGYVIAQDEASSVVWGMPGAVASAGLAEQILPLGGMAEALVKLTASRRTTRGLALSGTGEP